MKATGSAALLGFAVDAPSDLYSIGHPAPDLVAITKPATNATYAAGAAGNLTGAFAYRVSFGQPDGALTDPSQVEATIAAADQTVGSGLDDLTSGGTYTGSADATYTVKISTAAGTDKMQWRKGSGAWSAEANVVGPAMPLSDGVTGTFGATTGHTLGDSWTITVTIGAETVTAQSIDLAAIPLSVDAKCDRRVIERSADNGATWAICHTIYDNTTETYTDDTATLDTSKTLPSVNQTGANYGYVFQEPDSNDMAPDFTMLAVTAAAGVGKRHGAPGPIKLPGAPKADVRMCDLFPTIVSGAGAPDTYAQVAGEPTWIARWTATTGYVNPRSISAMTYKGSVTTKPVFFYDGVCEELLLSFSGGKITDVAPKYLFANYGTSAPAAKVAGDGTWAGTFIALGERHLNPSGLSIAKSVFLEITQALSANVVKFKVSVDDHSSVGGGTYGDEYTLVVNATSARQTKGVGQYSEWIKLLDQNGIRLGADEKSNRQPYFLIATAPLTTDLHVGDIYEILPSAAIPGIGAAPFSGVPPRTAQGPRFTDAHVTVKQNGVVTECQGGTLKLKWPKKDIFAVGSGARTPIDIANDGVFGAEVTLVRYLDSDENRDVMVADATAAWRIEIEGERIPINPGVTPSAYREGLYVDLPVVSYTSVKAPVAGQTLVVETINGEAEKSENPEVDLYAIELVTRQAWAVPAA